MVGARGENQIILCVFGALGKKKNQTRDTCTHTHIGTCSIKIFLRSLNVKVVKERPDVLDVGVKVLFFKQNSFRWLDFTEIIKTFKIVFI